MTDVKINVTFVIPKHCKDENDCSEDMLIAYTACENHRGGGLTAQFAHEKSVTFERPFTKSDIFVLSEFEGELYEKLKATKCLLVGPRCLSCSLTEGSSIPTKGHPVYTIAMRGLIVTLSGITKELKTSLKQKIEWMGGTYSAVLSSDTTHLIANNVFSDKYTKAAERGIPVMKDTWINAVWEASLKLDINGSSSEFDTHRLPPFANLQITTSGLNSHDKKLVMKLVNANGGDFSRVFLSQTTNVLVLTKESTSSEKYKAAVEFGKVCVTPHWVKDSAALGFALPVSRYKVTSTTTSSPLRDRQVPDMSLNLTRITRDGKPSNFVDESKMAESIMLSGTPKMQRDSRKDSITDEIQKAFEAFDVSSIKKAGPIFDGFCIWVSGLDGMPRDRAWACVSKTGGTRYDGPNARVTHAVSWGAAAVAAAAALPAVPVLSPLWLLRSVEAGRVLDETEFVINTEPATPRKTSQPALAAASPMSKRTLQLLLPPRDTTVTEEPQRDHIVDHYLSQNMSQAAEANNKSPEPVERKDATKNDENTAVTVSEFTQSENIFKGLVFEVQGLEDEAICEIGAEILATGGTVAAAGAGGTHVLVPLDFHTRLGTGEAVTVFWVKDCLSRQELTPIEYYHRPVHLKDPTANPLHGVVLSLSNYSGVERAFLDELAKLLGAVVQQRFCRRSNNSALASTHLVCPSPAGAKYSAARKWGVPVVRAGWLLACAATAAKADEAAHEVDREAADSTPGKQNTLVNALPPETPEPKNSTPVPRKPTPEPEKTASELEKTASEPEKRPSEPRSRTHEALPHEDMDANLVPDVEHMLPPDVATHATSPRTMKKYNKINNKNELFMGMSPASRFIAMRRMGMFSEHEDSSKENTPKKTDNDSEAPPRDAAAIQTPPLEEVLSSPNLQGFSPNSRRRLQAIRRGEVPEEPIKTPVNPFDKQIETPDSAFGAMLRPGRKRMSVDARKLLWEFVSDLPTNEPRGRPADLETPPSKMAKSSADQSAGGAKLPEERSAPQPPLVLPLEVDEQLQRLNVVLTGRRTPRRASRALQPDKPAGIAGGAKLPEERSAPQPPLVLPLEVDEQLQRLNVVLTGRRTPRRASRALQPDKPAGIAGGAKLPEERSAPQPPLVLPLEVDEQLQRLNVVLTGRRTPRRASRALQPDKPAGIAGGAKLPEERSAPQPPLVLPLEVDEQLQRLNVVLTGRRTPRRASRALQPDKPAGIAGGAKLPEERSAPQPPLVLPLEVDEQLQRLNVVLTGRRTPRRASRALQPDKPAGIAGGAKLSEERSAPQPPLVLPLEVDEQLQRLNVVLTGRRTPRRASRALQPDKPAGIAGGAKLPEERSAPQPPLVLPLEVDEQLQRLNVVLTGRRTPRRASRALQPDKPAGIAGGAKLPEERSAPQPPLVLPLEVDEQLQRLNVVLTGRRTPRRASRALQPDKPAGIAGGAKLPEERSAPQPPLVLPLEVDEQLQRLNVVLTGRRTPRRASRALQPDKPADMELESGPESQPNTVGWDDTTPSQKDSFESVSKPQHVETITKLDSKIEPKDTVNVAHGSKMGVEVTSQAMAEKSMQTKEKNVAPKTVKRFMLSSNVDNREETVEMILRLGGEVTDLEEEEEGPPATHLLCCAPARSQRVLNCIASGCWVLHPAYVARSTAVGMFLQEEAYEWGNPVASCLPAVSGGERVLAAAAHRWRARRAAGRRGPFAGVAALLHAPEPRRKLLARLVKAGGGTVVDEEPPYTDETITVCFADPKRYPIKERDRAWLVSRRVPVCASILLSAFLTEENRPDLNQHCLPEFKA